MDLKHLPFKVYLVGGAVRDHLLGLPRCDRDWVVVGATPQAMLDAGFKPVGKDFPVFLHPRTGEEYALARSERKRGHGYHGFVVNVDPSVTLEQDLARRDLTINAMAEDIDGRIIDPYGGQHDLLDRTLRHVSPAFVEDPVRLLRIARFAARYEPMGFQVAPETLLLLRQMVAAGEIDHLVPERVWTELRKGLAESRPSAMLRLLRRSDALARLLPEVDVLYGVPQRTDYHPERDTGTHVEMALDVAARIAPRNDLVGFAVLVHDLGKALSSRADWPRHVGHETRGLSPLRALCTRLRIGTSHRELAEVVCRYHLDAHRALRLRAGTTLNLLERIDALRRPERLRLFVLACEADARGRGGHENDAYPQAERLRKALGAARAVSVAPLLAQGLSGDRLGTALRESRCRAIAGLDAGQRHP